MKYYIWVLGCAMNYSDAERLMSLLESFGYAKTTAEEEADIIFVISCSVRQSAIDRIYGSVEKWNLIRKKKPLKLALSGCVLEKDRKKMEKAFDVIFNIKDLALLPQMLGVAAPGGEALDYFSIHPKYESSFQAYVPISTGCNNFCTYCAVPYTRGREKSRKPEEIIMEVKGLIESGYKEITLLGQNVNSYGQDLESQKTQKGSVPFVELLLTIDKIPGEYRVYFYSNHPKDMADLLIKTIPTLEHFPAYIHLPLQSGNDEIIKKMNRHYSKEKYLQLVKKIRETIPEVALTTDIIVGFPGETREQFQDTVDVMEIAGYDMAFLARYSPRSGTVAAKMADTVSKEEKREREDVLQKVLERTALANNQKLVGKKLRVLIDGEKDGRLFGRTDLYKVVEIKTDRTGLIGQFVMVEIVSATAWKLSGSLA